MRRRSGTTSQPTLATTLRHTFPPATLHPTSLPDIRSPLAQTSRTVTLFTRIGWSRTAFITVTGAGPDGPGGPRRPGRGEGRRCRPSTATGNTRPLSPSRTARLTLVSSLVFARDARNAIRRLYDSRVPLYSKYLDPVLLKSSFSDCNSHSSHQTVISNSAPGRRNRSKSAAPQLRAGCRPRRNRSCSPGPLYCSRYQPALLHDLPHQCK